MEDPSIVYRVAVAPSRLLLERFFTLVPALRRRAGNRNAFDDGVNDTRQLGGNCCERLAPEIRIVAILGDVALEFVPKSVLSLADRNLCGNPARATQMGIGDPRQRVPMSPQPPARRQNPRGPRFASRAIAPKSSRAMSTGLRTPPQQSDKNVSRETFWYDDLSPRRSRSSHPAAAIIVWFKRLHAPALDFRQLRFRPFDRDIALAGIDRPLLAVDRKPIPFFDRNVGELRAMSLDIDLERRAADNAGLAHLPRHQRGMRGPPADGRHNSGGDGKPRDIGRAGIGPDQNDRLATGGEALGARRIKSRAPDRDSRGCTGAARNGLGNIDQAFMRERA